MNGIALFNALTKIDDRFIDRAEKAPATPERPRRAPARRWVEIAACACLLLTVSLLIVNRVGPFGHAGGKQKPGGSNYSAVDTGDVAAATDARPSTQAGTQAIGHEGTWAAVDENTDYSLSVVGGRNYLNFDGGNASYSSIKGTVYFETVDAMVTAIRTNSLSPDQCETIRNSFPQDENGIRIVDLDHVFDAALPDELISRGVIWEGPSYLFPFDDENNVTGYLNVLSPEDYATVFAKEYAEFFNREQITVTSRYHTEERNAEIILYSTDSADLKRIRYTLPNGVTVDEKYALTSRSGLLETSPTVPAFICLYYESESFCFTGEIYGLTERPTVEWLSRFGLTER